MKYIVTINDKNYEVEVEQGRQQLLNHSGSSSCSTTRSCTCRAPLPGPSPNLPVLHLPCSGEAIKAPMPGTILDIKVTPGASVKEGDILVILEAMKMENEILAPRDGVVSQIITSKGASVSTGDVLLSLN